MAASQRESDRFSSLNFCSSSLGLRNSESCIVPCLCTVAFAGSSVSKPLETRPARACTCDASMLFVVTGNAVPEPGKAVLCSQQVSGEGYTWRNFDRM